MLVEGVGRVMLRIPCDPSPIRIMNETVDRVLVRVAPAEAARLFKGCSGSPVFDARGTLLGAVSTSLNRTRAAEGFGMISASDLRTWWRVAREDTARLKDTCHPLDERAKVEPGQSVAAAWIWGDLVAARSGAITACEGSEALLFAHPMRTGSGNCAYALLDAPVVALAETEGEVTKITSPGPLLGAILHDSERGLYAIVGVSPPAISVAVTCECSGLPPVVRRYFVARDVDPEQSARGLTIITMNAINAAEMPDAGSRTEIRIAVADSDPTTDVVRTSGSLRALAAEAVRRRCWPFLASAERIEVTVSMSS